jgi:hypothetical protein
VPDQQQHELREPESAAASAALVPATAFGVPVSSPAAMTDREIEQSFRVAKALAQSGLYKDVESAEQAFAKLLMGRDLGLSHSQSLSLYAMDGKVEVPYHLLATFVRRRPGYGFAIEWRYADGGEGRWVAATDVEGNAGGEVTGARITFTVDGIVAGVSTFTVEDAVTAELTGTRGGRKSNHVKYPRNMFLARAMSNGCRWYVPEVLAGLPVYAEGELPRTEALGQGVGSGEAEPGWGDMPIDLASDVERVIRLAGKRGHAGLSNRASVQLQLRGQTPGAVRVWIREAMDELNAMVRESSVPLGEPEVVEAERAADAEAQPDEPEPDPSPPVALVCTACGSHDEYLPSGFRASALGPRGVLESALVVCTGCENLTEHVPDEPPEPEPEPEPVEPDSVEPDRLPLDGE